MEITTGQNISLSKHFQSCKNRVIVFVFGFSYGIGESHFGMDENVSLCPNGSIITPPFHDAKDSPKIHNTMNNFNMAH